MTFFDELEIRTADQRASDLEKLLPALLLHARDNTTAYKNILKEFDLKKFSSLSSLAELPITRKSLISDAQGKISPFGGYTPGTASSFEHIFQSPGPIYEPGRIANDWWRMGRFIHALGIGHNDIVQNCFSYHMTPAGMMFENGARTVGATVFPAGVGQSELQARAAADIGVTAYAGTPDFLKTLLDKADDLKLDLSRLTKAAVGGGALFPSLRQEYIDRGITCLQSYGTADLGNIAYESTAMDGMIVDEGVIVEIVTPGSGIPVPEGEVGEVIVTTLNKDYPLIRFATGDMSAVHPGQSPCGRTNMRIKGWLGRADQTTKIKGMFVRPEQVADFVEVNEDIIKARVVADRVGEKDKMTIMVETLNEDRSRYGSSITSVFKLRGEVIICSPGTLPKDGLVIEDKRSYQS
ncbi:MAG: AMP-binding protein [Rhodobacteraceae bacterium]|nr:AMP-binding protein [Paracoccaceae bacterium]